MEGRLLSMILVPNREAVEAAKKEEMTAAVAEDAAGAATETMAPAAEDAAGAVIETMPPAAEDAAGVESKKAASADGE